MSNKILIVDTSPQIGRGSNTINFGLQVVRDIYKADVCKWEDSVNVDEYKTIGFNVFYAMNLLNVYPFLAKNDLLPGSNKRNKIKIIAGGQGINRNGILSSLVDDVFYGEIDGCENKNEIVSNPILNKNHAVVEIQRGCRYRCKFCQYGNDRGGKYREKPVELAKEQISELSKRGVNQVNFLSVNLGGYNGIGSLIEHCVKEKVKIRSADTTINDFNKLKDFMQFLPKSWRLGVETFDYKTRKNIGKGFSDDTLFSTLDFMLSKVNMLHIYLIYGLPNDNYSEWLKWTKIIGDLMKTNTKTSLDLFGDTYITNKIRIDFSVSTFEPEEGTPFSDSPMANFEDREKFLPELIEAMKMSGIINTTKNVKHTEMMGKFGRSKKSYDVLMKLKRGDIITGEKLFYKYKFGYR